MTNQTINKELTNKEILDIELLNDEFPGWTIRKYLKELLILVIWEQEGFSGKRPFGNSCWEYDLIIPLVRNGVVRENLMNTKKS